MRKDWRDFLIQEDEAEELKEAFIVFEEYEENKKNDLTKGIFSNLEVAKEYAKELNKYAEEKNRNYVSIYADFINGDYEYL